MSLRVYVGILLIVTLAAGTPLERARQFMRPNAKAPSVVDIPAGMFEADDDFMSFEPSHQLTKVPLNAQEPEVEFLPPWTKTVVGESQDTPITTTKDEPDRDIFGVRVPTIFVIRRPVFRDPFESFAPFQGFRPFSGFGERRPVLTDASTDKEDRFDLANNMETMMKRMQEQMSSLWGSFMNPNYQRPFRPVFPSFESAETDTSASNETSVINIDKLPDNYSNTTSETKVVDGHVVQVNKTVHKISSGNNTRGFFSFQVINVRPTEGAKPAETEDADSGEGQAIIPSETKPEGSHTTDTVEVKPTPTSTTVKSEDPTLNEVGADETDKETFPYVVNGYDPILTQQAEDQSPEFEIIPYQKEIKPRSLSGDLRVNKLMAEQRLRAPYVRINPDVEYVDV